MIENRNFSSPTDMAWHLAGYVTCASSIASFTANHFGKGRGVSLAKAKGMIDARQKKRLRKDVHGDDFDQAESESIARMEKSFAKSSAALAKVVRLQAGLDWPCGHVRNAETTHTIAGKEQCRVCRRSRWNAGFKRAVIRLAAQAERRRVLAESLALVSAKTAEERAQRLKEITEGFDGKIPLTELMFCVAASFKITVPEMRGPERHRNVVHARAVVAKILFERGATYPRIGSFLGGRDHSTAIHAVKSFETYVKRDPRVLDVYRAYGDAKDEG